MIPETEVLARLHKVVSRYPYKYIAAHAMGVHESYLSDVLHGRKSPSPYLLSLVGVRRRKVFIYTEAP